MPDALHNQTHERFVAFAFAGAELMLEADSGGSIAYATGSFQKHFGRPPGAFAGATLSSLVAPADHEALEMALALLKQRGRLLPVMLRLADRGRSSLALAGILLPVPGSPPRLCLTFAQPPEPAGAMLRPASAQGFLRAAQARLRAGDCPKLHLLEIKPGGNMTQVGEALQAIAPDGQSGELSPGRFGLFGDARFAALAAEPGALQAALRQEGVEASVRTSLLNMADHGLTPAQAARALRQALTSFARGGARALDEVGLTLNLAGQLRQAGRKADIIGRVIRETKFDLVFQPIVALAGRAPHHYEALIRPRAIPEMPLSGPQEFVLLAEALGLADELDWRVASLACDCALAAGLPVAFNISGQSAQNPPFRGRLSRLLESHKAVRAGLILIEMTETAEIDEVAEASLTAQALRRLNVAFCLDDFGAGAADLRLLRALTPNIVKLDGSYMQGIARPGRERAFIAGVVEIARAAGAEMVAERVETEAEAAILTDLGVTYGQGWHFGRPGALSRQVSA